MLRVLVTPTGLITGWKLGSAATAERWVADVLLRGRVDPQAAAPTLAELAAPLVGHDHPTRPRLGPPGPVGPTVSAGHGHDAPLLADLGVRGVTWAAHWQQDDGTTVGPKAVYDVVIDREERRSRTRMFHGARQVLETVGTWLCDRCTRSWNAALALLRNRSVTRAPTVAGAQSAAAPLFHRGRSP